jgi:lipid-A-disaccharide synthase
VNNKQPLTVMIVAGEASGDQHAAHMFLELRKQLPDIKGIGMGGTKMQAAGIDIRYDSSNIAVIGVIEVLKHYPEIKRALQQMQQLLTTKRPDLLVCVDYKEFNFKLAGFAKSIGIKVLFYVSPQIWAWREGRVVKYGKVIDAMAVIFPFEVAYYERHHIPVRYVGHPSVDKVHPQLSLSGAKKQFGLTDNAPVVGLLPGSRSQEIKRLLPVMLLAAKKIQETIPDVQFLLPQADTISDSLLQTFIQAQPLVIKTIKNQPYDVMQCCDAIITTSGTATLEIALLEIPMVIVYKLAQVTYLLGRLLVKIPFIGLPNIIAGHSVVKEFIQNQASPVNIAEETIHILQDQQYAQEIKLELQQIKKILGSGNGSKNTADFALELLQR